MSDTSDTPELEELRSRETVTGRELDACLEVVRRDIENSMITAESKIGIELSEIKRTLSSHEASTKWWVMGTGLISIVSITTILLAVLSYAGDRFDGGLSASSLTVQSEQNRAAIEQQNEKMEEALKILRIIGAEK